MVVVVVVVVVAKACLGVWSLILVVLLVGSPERCRARGPAADSPS